MFMIRVISVALLAIVASGCAGASGMQKSDSAIQFNTLEKMVGDWAMVGEDGKAMPGLALSSHYSAGGSAIVESIFPGADHEMTSVYYSGDGEVLMTHYCALGNAPNMRVEQGENENTWVFTCDGHGSNYKESDKHMHRGELTWIDENTFESSWSTMTDGELEEPFGFKMVRVTSPE